MRLHRIVLRNFRGVDHAEVSLATDGVTVIEGDNETGKTSLTDAVRLLLEERDSSTKQEIRDAQPKGLDVGPEVEVELTTGPYRVTYAKRWVRQKMTTLTVHEPRREQHTGRAAHERMNALLDETLDRALLQALRVDQGGVPDAGTLDVPSLGRALDLAVGSDAAGDREDALWDRIVAERDRYWTSTGQPKAPRPDLARRLSEATAQVQQVRVRIHDVEDKVERMARLGADARVLEEQQVALEERRAALDARDREVTGLRAAVASLRAEAKAAQAELDRWTQQAATRVELTTSVGRTEERLTADLERARAAEATRAEAQARLEVAEADTAHAEQALAVAEAHHALAMGDEDHRRREIEVEQIRERCVRVEAEQAALTAAERLLAAVAVDPAMVAAIEAAERELLRAEAAAGAGAATVTITALADTTFGLDGEDLDLDAGATSEVRLTSEVEVVVPGVATISINAGAADQELAAAVEQARTTLAEACRTAGVADLAEARAAAAARAEAERVRHDAKDRIAQDLRDLTPEALARKADKLARQVETYLIERPSLPPMPGDHGEAQATAARAEADLAASKTAATKAAAALAAAGRETDRVALDATRLAERVENHETGLADLTDRLRREREVLEDDALHDRLAAANDAAGRAAEALAAAEARLAAEAPDALDRAIQDAATAVAAGRTAIDRNRREADHLRGELDVAGEQGLSQQLHDAETARQHLAREVEATDARAEAARLLHDTFAERRSETRNRYAAPLQDAIERLGRMVFGPTFAIELDDALTITTRTLDGVTVAVHQLSTGAREQLGLIARLACASIVAADGGAPVVFDDALGWTDPARLAQMGAAIADAGKQCQIVVLTCTPGRYSSVRGATTVRLRPPPVTLFDLDAG